VGRCILVRHGESEANDARVFTSHPEVGLTERGRAQAADAAALIARRFAVRRVVASPLRRARQTADVIAGGLGLAVDVEDALRERGYGDFAGVSYDAPRPGWDRERWWEWRPPGGETLIEVVARAGAALDRIAAAAPVDDVVVVSHGGVMLALERHVTGRWGVGRVARNAGIAVATHRDGRWTHLEIVATAAAA
jgi:broad specificity phosphatase PhoE